MRIYTRYKGAARRGLWRSVGYGVAAGAGLGFLGWALWHTAQDLQQVPAPVPAQPRAGPASQAAPSAASQPPAQPGPVQPSPPPSGPGVTNAPRIVISTNLVVRTNANPLLAAPAVRTNVAVAGTNAFVQPVGNVLEAQVALARLGISSGAIDGVLGAQTRAALRVYQRRERLPVTGQLDAATRGRLGVEPPVLTQYVVTTNDVAELRPLRSTWLGKSQQDRLGFETVLEAVAERFQAHPQLVRSLNPQVDWTVARPGLRLVVPSTVVPAPGGRAAKVRISLWARSLQVYGPDDRLMAHFPCSIARRVDKRPVGTLRVVVIIRDPSYTFNPEVFPESAEARRLGRKLVLPPGPNNPVGTAWIGLDRPGYGIHGTPRPEEVGRTESHGCFRLANWNADCLARLVVVGTPVIVEP